MQDTHLVAKVMQGLKNPFAIPFCFDLDILAPSVLNLVASWTNFQVNFHWWQK